MHSKVAVVDQHWATIGSSNIDPFSLLLSREANIVILDAAFAQELRSDILATVQNGAHHISILEWAHGKMMHRVVSWLAYRVVRILLELIGYSNE